MAKLSHYIELNLGWGEEKPTHLLAVFEEEGRCHTLQQYFATYSSAPCFSHHSQPSGVVSL